MKDDVEQAALDALREPHGSIYIEPPPKPTDCRTCKAWKECGGHDNYSYAEIRWCPYQVLWLLENAETLRGTGWLNRDDNKGSRNTPTDGNFVSVISVLAELDVRLAKCHKHGQKLREQAEEGRLLSGLSPNARSALMYVKGWRRKVSPYTQWLREVYYKNRSPKTVAKFQGKPEKRS